MRMTTGKLTLMAVLTAAALVVFVIEAAVPIPIPIPGAKLGLANVVTLFALYFSHANRSSISDSDNEASKRINAVPQNVKNQVILTAFDAFLILICRIMLGAFFSGMGITLIYSLAGGLTSFAAQAILRRCVTNKQIWVCGVMGAVFHNIGQICVAIPLTGTASIISLLPPLTAAGIATGIITGFTAQFALIKLRAIRNL